ncbi:hypothetical protein V8G54_007326 [Vigna mungo]|uniref:Uncharacterized protein n=1 Tax=Vigna mungo TaxID=3915 RepID=A0AAQ3S5C8_VIGMU
MREKRESRIANRLRQLKKISWTEHRGVERAFAEFQKASFEDRQVEAEGQPEVEATTEVEVEAVGDVEGEVEGEVEVEVEAEVEADVEAEGRVLELVDPLLLDSAVAPGEPGGADNVMILKQGIV